MSNTKHEGHESEGETSDVVRSTKQDINVVVSLEI